MNYEEALKLIESKFKTRYIDEYARAVRLNLTYDGVNELQVVLCAENDRIFLSDEGETKNVFWKNAPEEELNALCELHGFLFNEYGHVELPFTSLNDLYSFIDFLLLICDRFNPIGN